MVEVKPSVPLCLIAFILLSLNCIKEKIINKIIIFIEV